MQARYRHRSRIVHSVGIAILALSLAGQCWPTLAANKPSKFTSVIRIANPDGAPVAKSLHIGLNKSIVVETNLRVGSVVVSTPKILDATVQTSQSVVLMGMKAGQSNVLIFDEAGSAIASLDVVIEMDMTPLREMLARFFPDANLEVENANDNLIVKGTLDRPIDASRAADIASSFLPEGKKLLNMIEVRASEQVLLQVTVAEMQRDIIKRLGVNWNGFRVGDTAIGGGTNNNFPITGATGNDSFLYGVVGGDLASCLIPGIAAGVVAPPTTVTGLAGKNCLARTIDAFERDGLVRTLAEPKLTAISGEQANFLAGGEIPVPVAEDNGKISVSWKPFGVRLEFAPNVLAEERINLKVMTEVSELTSVGSVKVADISIPAITVRRASTTLELPSGGSLVLAGLLSNDLSENVDGVPALKNLPILGTLFRSKDFRDHNTELVIIVTPYVVNPVSRAALARPDDNLMPADDARGFLLEKFNRIYGDPDHPPVGRFSGDIGFVIE